MNRLLLLSFIGLVIASCSTRTGHVTGVLNRPIYQPEIPLGMVYVKSGAFNMGENDQDVPFLHQTRAKTASVQAFYMDQTEVTNNEYRQFVEHVKDSIAREKIYLTSEDEASQEFINYQERYFDEDSKEFVDYDASDKEKNRSLFTLNWDKKFDYTQEEYVPILADMYYPSNERFYKKREIDTRKLLYKYWWLDLKEAARRGRIDIVPNGIAGNGNKVVPTHRELITPTHPFTGDPQGQDLDLGHTNKKGQNNAIRGHANRQRFIIEEVINIYPDTLCWVRDFTYAFHDPMTNMYFHHPAYDNYPVVGVTWQQARAYSNWRSWLLNSWLVAMGDLYINDFRLPTETEWERAARGDLDNSQYPWGGPYTRNAYGCFLANFKPMRGRYAEDGGFHTVKAFSYQPNGFGLYCMAGNVAEWCETAYDESAYEFSNDINSEYRYDAMDWDPHTAKRKVIRGGSWKDIGYYCMTSTRSYEYQDTAKSYIGFRNVVTHMGRGGDNIANEGSEELINEIELK
jgi:formylglycine-generating enzyme required for sulfatase activity